MDISKASNFERFVFDLLGRDAERTADLFGKQVQEAGGFTLGAAERGLLSGFGFVSGRSTHADRLATIRQTWAGNGTLVDTHTADGLKVAREHVRPGVPMIVMETALPAKFAQTIEEALGMTPALPAGLSDLEGLPRRFTVMPVDTEAVKQYIRRHA